MPFGSNFRLGSPCRKRMAVTVFALWLLCSPSLSSLREVRADEPITLTTVVVAVAAVGTIITSLGWIIDRLSGNDKVCTTTTVTTTTTSSSGGTQTQTVTTTKCSQSPQSIVVPADFPGLVVPAGFSALSETTFFDAQADEQVNLQYQNLDYQASVLRPESDLTRVSYDIQRTTVFRFLRPPGAQPGEQSRVTIPISADGVLLATSKTQGTDGVVGWSWKIETAELGTLFQSDVRVAQGARPTITGDIPASSFVTSIGRAKLDNFASNITVLVPAGVNQLNFTVTSRNTGVGERSFALFIPTLSTVALVVLALILVGAALSVLRRRRHSKAMC